MKPPGWEANPEVNYIKSWCVVTREEDEVEVEEEKTEKPKQSKAKKADKKAVKQINPITRYFRETRGELRKVTWPTRQESWRLTAIVLAVSTLMAAFLWVWDLLFSQSIHMLIRTLIGA